MSNHIRLLTALLVAGCGAAPNPMVDDESAAKADLTGDQRPSGTTESETSATSKPIRFHGGSVMRGVTNVYYIWYGTWTDQRKKFLTDFVADSSGSRYFRINTRYTDVLGRGASADLHFAGDYDAGMPYGDTISDDQVWQLVKAHVYDNNNLPPDSNGVYLVLTSLDIKYPDRDGKACGWHNVTGGNQFGWIGEPRGPICYPQAFSPNDDYLLDAMTSEIAHELSETVTDPGLFSWFDSDGNENADKCFTVFNNAYLAANGAKANVHLGNRDYLLQANWLIDGSYLPGTKWILGLPGHCAMSIDEPAR